MRILYLDLDALTPSHLGCYGYERNTSPTIDQLAREGLRCNNVYTCDAPCLPSRTAFYSGRFGIQTGVVGHGQTAAQPKVQGASRGFRDYFDESGLARQLQDAGLHTAMISPFGQRHAAHHFYAGFNEIHNTGKGGLESAEDVMPIATRWLDDHAARDNWYLHINFWDIHTPYRAPQAYGNKFEDTPLPADALDIWKRHAKKSGPHSAMDPGMYRDADSQKWPRMPRRIDSEATLKQWFDGYDTAIRYVDDQIKWMVDRLKAAGVYEDTVIIISADHGENQGELGIYGEHGTADHATCRIPMIVKWPGGATGKVDEQLHYNLDWAPTLMELLDRPARPIWDGQSYAATIRTGEPAGRKRLILSQCCHVCQRSVRFDNWLWIRTWHDGFHLFPQEMLFDLDHDPMEQHNLATHRPDLCAQAAHAYLDWHSEQMQKMAQWSSDMIDPMWTVIREGGPFHASTTWFSGADRLGAYLERLDATGRADGAQALRERYADVLEPTR